MWFYNDNLFFIYSNKPSDTWVASNNHHDANPKGTRIYVAAPNQKKKHGNFFSEQHSRCNMLRLFCIPLRFVLFFTYQVNHSCLFVLWYIKGYTKNV